MIEWENKAEKRKKQLQEMLTEDASLVGSAWLGPLCRSVANIIQGFPMNEAEHW